MDLTLLFAFIHDNMTPLLGAMAVVSFVLNVIQHKSKRSATYFFDTIYQTCIRTIRERKSNRSDEELFHLFYVIRGEAVSGLRSLGVERSYGRYDHTATTIGPIYRALASGFRIAMKIREKLPDLFRRRDE